MIRMNATFSLYRGGRVSRFQEKMGSRIICVGDARCGIWVGVISRRPWVCLVRSSLTAVDHSSRTRTYPLGAMPYRDHARGLLLLTMIRMYGIFCIVRRDIAPIVRVRFASMRRSAFSTHHDIVA